MHETEGLEFQHDHLAVIHGGVESSGTYYMISKFTSEGHLEDFMQKHSKGINTVGLNYHWFISQLEGLSGALNKVHNPAPSFAAFHHDIKPANILVFSDTNENGQPVVRFKLTDWGCAVVQSVGDPPSSPRSNRNPNPSYNPPEADNDQYTSRPHDIWSLGCVLLELCIWFVKGYETLGAFRTLKFGENDLDKFFPSGSAPYTLSSCVDRALIDLAAHDDNLWGKQADGIRLMLEVTQESRPGASDLADK